MSFASKFRKRIEKVSSPFIHHGFPDPKTVKWASVGNYAMNKLISGTYTTAFPTGKSIIVGGESGSGKSLILATSAAEAQREHNAYVFWIDTEGASDSTSPNYDPDKDPEQGGKWFKALGVNLDDDNFAYTQAATVEDVKKLITEAVTGIDEMKEDDIRPLVIVVDSWTNIMTEKQTKEAISGVVKGDQGQRAKQLKDLIQGMTHRITRRPIWLWGVVHTYESQDMFDPDEKMSGGRGLVYMASVAFVFTKYKLKAKEAKQFEEDLKDLSDSKVIGSKAKVRLYKSRFSKPNEMIDVSIVWPNGLDKVSGLFDYLKEEGVIQDENAQTHYVAWPEGIEPPKGFPATFKKKEFRSLASAIVFALDGKSSPEPWADDVFEDAGDDK